MVTTTRWVRRGTLLIQDVLAEPVWDDVLTVEDYRGLTR